MNRSSSIQNVEGKWLRSILKLIGESLYSALLHLLPTGTQCYHVHRVAQFGRTVCLHLWISLGEIVSNKRHLIGVGLGMVGGIAIFFHLLFDETSRNLSWYYVNWFYFFHAIRGFVALFFIATAMFLFHPVKFKVTWVVYTLAVSGGICGVIHYSFFVTDDLTYHAFPDKYIIIMALAMGFGFLKSMDYLCYRKYHLKDGNMARIKGIIRVPGIAAEEKIKMLVALLDEQENFNARV